MRKFSPKEAEANIRPLLNTRNWDYRWDTVPKSCKFKLIDHKSWLILFFVVNITDLKILDYNVTKPVEGDTSIVTFKGHRVQKSLIRAKFSPAASTGQRYCYVGCATGRLISKCQLTTAAVALFNLFSFQFTIFLLERWWTEALRATKTSSAM